MSMDPDEEAMYQRMDPHGKKSDDFKKPVEEKKDKEEKTEQKETKHQPRLATLYSSSISASLSSSSSSSSSQSTDTKKRVDSEVDTVISSAKLDTTDADLVYTDQDAKDIEWIDGQLEPEDGSGDYDETKVADSSGFKSVTAHFEGGPKMSTYPPRFLWWIFNTLERWKDTTKTIGTLDIETSVFVSHCSTKEDRYFGYKLRNIFACVRDPQSVSGREECFACLAMNTNKTSYSSSGSKVSHIEVILHAKLVNAPCEPFYRTTFLDEKRNNEDVKSQRQSQGAFINLNDQKSRLPIISIKEKENDEDGVDVTEYKDKSKAMRLFQLALLEFLSKDDNLKTYAIRSELIEKFVDNKGQCLKLDYHASIKRCMYYVLVLSGSAELQCLVPFHIKPFNGTNAVDCVTQFRLLVNTLGEKVVYKKEQDEAKSSKS